jgi:hypothetical protein
MAEPTANVITPTAATAEPAEQITEAAATAEPVFTREQLAASKKYAAQSDVVNAVLKEGQTYTLRQADAAIQSFREGVVK